MTLIADSGSTKTAWAVAAGDVSSLATEGLNPHFTSDEVFLRVFARVRAHFGVADALWFYGAGCGNAKRAERLRELALRCGVASEVYVGTDLLGACRAVAGNEPGYVAIMGTGSNCCYYDGTDIVLQATSTGYVLGDHGSANHVGRMLLQDYLSGVMPDDVADAFHTAYPLEPSAWIDRVYHQPQANRFLATLAPFATAHSDFPYCREIVHQSLEKWYFYQLSPLLSKSRVHNDEETLRLVGSFGHVVSPILSEVLSLHGIRLVSTLANPLSALVAYHSC